MTEKVDMNFCIACGRPLDKKLNKRMRYGEANGYCNNKCARMQIRKERPRNRPKYGVAGVGFFKIRKDVNG